MRIACLLAVLGAAFAAPHVAAAFEVENRAMFAAPQPAQSTLSILSTTDLEAFAPVIEAFQAEHPNVSVDYTIANTAQVMQAITQERQQFDLAISSAMDLQTKLANDGFAQRYSSPATAAQPDWAKWGDAVFAFTQEPATLVISEAAFEGLEVPRTRDELITLLRSHPERFKDKIGTYDVRISGLGYLFATQESRASESYWRLTEIMGQLGTRLYCCSGQMIDDVANGKLAMAYNVLGSYAASEQTATSGFRIIALSDFVNVMLRTVLIPKTAENIEGARAMVDFLTALNTRPDLVAASGLPAIDRGALQANTALRPIRFGPGLLVFLDQLKRSNFLRSWESSLEQE